MRVKVIIATLLLSTLISPAIADSPPVLSVGPDGRPLPGFNDRGEAVALPAPVAPPLTKDGTLAVSPDGKPLPGFNDKGEAVALPAPTPPASGVQAFDATGKPLVGFNDKGEAIPLPTPIPPTYNKITDQQLKTLVDSELSVAKITAVKQSTGYQLYSPSVFSAVDKSLTVIATKSGSKSKTLKLSVDAAGELFVATNTNLSGYKIQIKRGAAVLKSVKVN
jgi:hypothetical protein